MFGRVGAGGLQAVKDRQMQRGERLTQELEASLRVVQAGLVSPSGSSNCGGMRATEFWRRVAPYRTHQGSGGFQSIFTDAVQVRHSFVATVGERVYQHFQEGEHHIAQLELAMILYGLIANAAAVARGSWITRPPSCL